jgi:DNA polymerase III alpha subunit
MYIELHTSSAFSFLDGASLPEALVDRAVELGYPALALLDRDGVYGAPRFHLAARKAGIKAIVGAELTIAGLRDAGCGMRLPVLVESRDGYRNLSRLVTQMKLRSAKGEAPITHSRSSTATPVDWSRSSAVRRSTDAASGSAVLSIASSESSARSTPASSCSAICCATKKRITRRCAISRRRFTCR